MSFLIERSVTMNVSSNASNAWKMWAPDEMTRLLDEVKQPDMTIETIAQLHGRTTGGILARLRRWAVHALTHEMKSIEEVMSLTRFLDQSEVEAACKKKAEKRRGSKERQEDREERGGRKEQEDRFGMLLRFKAYLKASPLVPHFNEAWHDVFDVFIASEMNA